MSFKIETIDNGLRFVSAEGWADLCDIRDGKALLYTGTYNGTVPEVFGKTLWLLLHEIMPEMGLEVISAEVSPPDDFVERILLGAGFQKDGTRRRWGDNLEDISCYSILDREVRYEVIAPEVSENGLLPAG